MRENIVNEFKKMMKIKAQGKLISSEEKAFTTYNNDKLKVKERLIKEYSKIDTNFTFISGEEMNFEESNRIKSLINKLNSSIDDLNNYDIKVLMQIIVLVDLKLGVDISFYNAFYALINTKGYKGILSMLNNLDFDSLYIDLSKGENYGFRVSFNK